MPEDPDEINEGLESPDGMVDEGEEAPEEARPKSLVEEIDESKVQAGMESQTEDFVSRTLKEINDDPFNDLKSELKRFKEEYGDDPRDPRNSTPETRDYLDARLQASTKLTSSRIAADYERLKKNVERRTNVEVRRGLILNPGAREYIDVLSRGERGQLVMFQLQNKTIASSIASGVRTSLEITTQFAPSAEDVYNRELPRGDKGSMTTAIGILGPNQAFAEAVGKIEATERSNDIEETERRQRDKPDYTSKLTKDPTKFYGLRFRDGALMHAKLGYTERLDGSLASAFLGTQNLTTSLDKASTQEEALFLTVDESTERNSIKWQIANEIRNVSRVITTSAKQMLNESNGAQAMADFQKRVSENLKGLQERKYVKVGSEILQQNLSEFQRIAGSGGKLALNMQYVENFLTATDYSGEDSSWRNKTLQVFENLAAKGRLSLALSERSVNAELGYTRLIERLLEQDGDSAGKRLIFELAKRDRIRVIPTAFLHTKSFYEYNKDGTLVGVSTGSDNLASYEYTDPKRNFETRVYLNQKALGEVGVDPEDIAANTAFEEPGQMLAIQRYSDYEAVNRAYTSFKTGPMQEVNETLKQRGIGGFTVRRKFRTDGSSVFGAGDTAENLDKLATGLDITLSSGYAFGVTIGKRQGYDYSSKGGGPDQRAIIDHDVVYLNKGNRAITGAVLLNRLGSGVNLTVPGREDFLLKPGQATRLTAMEVLNTMIYTLSSAQQYDSEVSAPLRALRDSNVRRNQLQKDIRAVLEKAGTSPQGVLSVDVLRKTLKTYNQNLERSIAKGTFGGKISPALSSTIANRFNAVNTRDANKVLDELSKNVAGIISGLLEGDPRGPGYDVVAGYSDIVKLLIANDRELAKRYDDHLKEGRRTVFSQVVSSFFQPHESLFRGNQLAYQQPIFEVSGTTAALHGANNNNLSAQAKMMAVLSGSEISHYTKLNLVEGGSFIRTVQDSSRVKRVATQFRVGGMVFPEGGMTKITFGEGFMKSTSNLDYISRNRNVDDVWGVGNTWGGLNREVRELIKKTNEELFTEAPAYYFFPYAKTEQISARIKNKKSERGLLESSVEFTNSLRALGLGIKENISDPNRMLGGEIMVDLSAEQFDILRSRYGNDLTPENLADLRERQYNLSETTQGFIGRSAPKMFVINMGVSTMSDFGYINRRASTDRMMIDPQRYEETFQTQDLGPNFYAAVAKTLKAGTMFIAKPFEIEDEGYKRLASREVTAAFDSLQGLEEGERLSTKHLSAINKVLKSKNISVSLDKDNNETYYLNSGVYRNINETGQEKSLNDLKRVGELTQDLTFIVYGLEKTTILDGVQKSNYVPIVNSAIARRENRGVTVLKDNASLVSSGYAQQILAMNFVTGMESTTGSRPVGFKGPLVYLSEGYFEKLYQSISANRPDFMQYVPERLKTKQIEGVLAPSQIKDFNFTAGFALLEDPKSGLRGLLNTARGNQRVQLGKEIAAGLELMLPSGKSLFERGSIGIGTLNQYEGLALLTAGGESIEAGLKAVVQSVLQDESAEAAERLADRARNLVETSYKNSLRYNSREIIKSNRYTRAASLMAILTSMASDLRITSAEKTFSEVSFTEVDRLNYAEYLRKPEGLDADQVRRAQAQERLAYSMQINLREGDALETNFQYLNNLYSRNVFVRQFFEYGVSRIAVATGMQDTTALEASYASYMTKAQMDLQTYDPNSREYVTSLQRAIFSLVINTQPLFGKGDAGRFKVEQPRSLLTQGLEKRKEYIQGKQSVKAGSGYQKLESFALVNSFTNAYSIFGRRDLPDLEDGGSIAPNHVVDILKEFLSNTFRAGKKKGGKDYSANKLSSQLKKELRQMGANKSLVMAMSLGGSFEQDIQKKEILDPISNLLKESLKRKVTREKGLLNSINKGHDVGDDYIRQENDLGEKYSYFDLDNQEQRITPKVVFRAKKESIEGIESKPAFTETIGQPIIGFLTEDNRLIHVSQLSETDSIIRQEATTEAEVDRRIASLKEAPSGERSQWDRSLESMYNRIHQTKLSLKSSEGTTYLEGLTVLQRQTEGQLRVVDRLLKKDKKSHLLNIQKRDLLNLNREIIKTSVYTLPQLGALGVNEKTGEGSFVIDNTRPVIGAILGLDILKEIKLAFHGYTHNVLEDQAKMRGLLAEAESTGLFQVLAKQILAKPKDGVIKLTREQSSLYSRISEQMASSNYNTRELFNNQENLRRLQGDRLKQAGTTFVAFSSFLVGAQEYGSGTRADRINEVNNVRVDEIAAGEIIRTVRQAKTLEGDARTAGLTRAATYLSALLRNNQAEGVTGLSKKKVGAGSDLAALADFLDTEYNKYDGEITYNERELKALTEDARLKEVLASIGKKGQTYALANRTGAPNYSSEASGLYYLQSSINDLNARALSQGENEYDSFTYTNFQFSTRLSTTALALPTMGLQYTQLGDYDGDTFQLAFNKLSSIALQMQRLKGQISKMDASDSARLVARDDRNKLMEKFMQLYLTSSELTSRLEQKAKVAQDSFTRNFMILPQEIVEQLRPEQQATLVKQYRDSLSGSYGAASLVRKNFTKYVEHFVEQADGRLWQSYQDEGRLQTAGLTKEEYDAERVYVEGLLQRKGATTKADLVQQEADRINLEAARKNITKSLGSAAGSIITSEQLEVLQATVGTSGMGLLGEIYNTVTPMVDLAQGDRLQLLALDDQVLSERLMSAVPNRKGLSTEELKENMRGHYQQRLSNAYRFSVLTQQFMRDAALKPKEGEGVLQIAEEQDLYGKLKRAENEEAAKRVYKTFLAENVGFALTDYVRQEGHSQYKQNKRGFNVSAFGALTLLQEYIDSGKSATSLIGGSSLLSKFLGEQRAIYEAEARVQPGAKIDPGRKIDTDDDFMVNLLTDLTNSFQREYLISSVLEAEESGMQKMLSDLGGLIKGYANTEGGEYTRLVNEVEEVKQREGLSDQQRDVALYEGLMKIQQEGNRGQFIQQLRSLKRFKEGVVDYEAVVGPDDRIVQALGAKIEATELNIRRGKATQEDITDFVGLLTEELPKAFKEIQGLKGEEKGKALFGLSAMLEASGLLPSFVQEEISQLETEEDKTKARKAYIEALISDDGTEGSVASRMAELSGFSYLQANLRSRGEHLRNLALAEPKNALALEELDRVEGDLGKLEQAARDNNVKAVAEEISSRYNLDSTEGRSAEEQKLEDAANRVSYAAAGAAVTRTSQQVRRSYNRGEILSVLAVPLVMGSLQGGTMSVEQLGILASNVVQAVPMLSSYESSSLYGALHGNEKISKTELNRSQAVESQFYRARSREFIRSNENKLEGLLQATAFEGISRAAGRATVGATQAIANRFGDRGFFTSGGIGRGVSELLGGLAGMAVAGVITQRPITGTGQNMGSLPGYVLKTLSEISQSVQGAAQRYLQDLIEEAPEVSVDNEQAEATSGEISENFDSGTAFSGDIEKDWWSGWASPEEGVITFDSMETSSESIELGDSPEMT